jgi:hypothetical protein
MHIVTASTSIPFLADDDLIEHINKGALFIVLSQLSAESTIFGGTKITGIVLTPGGAVRKIDWYDDEIE